MNDDLRQLTEQLERRCAAYTEDVLNNVRRRVHARIRRRRIALGSLVAVFVVVIAGVVVASRDGDGEGVRVVDQPTTTDTDTPAPYPPEPDDPTSSTTVLGSPPTKTVDSDFSEGWVAVDVGLPGIEYGWVPEVLMSAPQISPGDVIETYASDGQLIGYYLRAAGFVSIEVYESPDFDWRAYISEAHASDPRLADRLIAEIEEAGGLGPIQTAGMAGLD